MVRRLEGHPSSTQELQLSQSDHWVLGHLLTRALLSQVLSLAGRPALERLGGSKLLPFKNYGGQFVLGNLQYCRNLSVPFPRSVPRHNPVSELSYSRRPRRTITHSRRRHRVILKESEEGVFLVRVQDSSVYDGAVFSFIIHLMSGFPATYISCLSL